MCVCYPYRAVCVCHTHPSVCLSSIPQFVFAIPCKVCVCHPYPAVCVCHTYPSVCLSSIPQCASVIHTPMCVCYSFPSVCLSWVFLWLSSSYQVPLFKDLMMKIHFYKFNQFVFSAPYIQNRFVNIFNGFLFISPLYPTPRYSSPLYSSPLYPSPLYPSPLYPSPPLSFSNSTLLHFYFSLILPFSTLPFSTSIFL